MARKKQLRAYQRYAESWPPKKFVSRYVQGGYHYIADAYGIGQAYAVMAKRVWKTSEDAVGLRSVKQLDTGKVKTWQERLKDEEAMLDV